jgi:cell division protein FtsZ
MVGSTLDPSLGGKMRVSVVATGIDAKDAQDEVPVPRRRLAEPLSAPAVEKVAEVPVAAAEPEAPAQQTLDVFDAHAASSAAQSADASDDLPPPAYQPRTQPAYQPPMQEAEPETYVAPRAPAAGTPSPDAMARLQAAVAKRPETVEEPRARPAQTFSEPEPAQQKQGRFGINSLIGRMTGTGEGAEAQARPAAPRAAAQPQVSQSYDEDQNPNPEQDKIEIPAFLRRQAN